MIRKKTQKIEELNDSFRVQEKKFKSFLDDVIKVNMNIRNEMNTNLNIMKEIGAGRNEQAGDKFLRIEKSFRNLTNVIDMKNTSLDRDLERMQKFDISNNDFINKKANNKNKSFGRDFRILENLKQKKANFVNKMKKSKSTNNIPYMRDNFISRPMANVRNWNPDAFRFGGNANGDSNTFDTDILNDNWTSIHFNQGTNQDLSEDKVKFCLTKHLQKRSRDEHPLNNPNFFYKKFNSVFKQ